MNNLRLMDNLRIGFITLLSIILASCATTYDSTKELARFEVRGRTALKSPDQNGQASFVWTQRSKNTIDLLVQGPLGKGRMDLKVNDHESTLIYDNQTYKDTTPDDLFYKVTQVNWPISGMKNWIVGQPNEVATEVLRGTNNRIASFNEAGWFVEYHDWMTTKGRIVPKRITISRDEIRIRFFIEQWAI